MNKYLHLYLDADGGGAASGASGTDGVAPVTTDANATAAETPQEESFDSLIKGKYKADFDKRMQAAIKRRVGDLKALEAENAKMRDALSIAMQRYGTKEGDYEALTNALIEDDAYLEKEAYEKGIDKDTLRTMKRMEHENERLKANQIELERKASAEMAYQKLLAEQEEVLKVYPNFNIDAEVTNPQFESLVRNGVDLKTAYEVVHHNEILPQAMKFASDKAREDVAKTVASGLQRPSELGAGMNDSPVTHIDVKSLTREQRDELNRRALAGERIVL